VDVSKKSANLDRVSMSGCLLPVSYPAYVDCAIFNFCATASCVKFNFILFSLSRSCTAIIIGLPPLSFILILHYAILLYLIILRKQTIFRDIMTLLSRIAIIWQNIEFA